MNKRYLLLTLLADAAADEPAKEKNQRASDAAKPAEERKDKNKAAEKKKAAKRTKSSDGSVRDASSAEVADLLSMVKNLKERVEETNAKLMQQAQTAILIYNSCRTRQEGSVFIMRLT